MARTSASPNARSFALLRSVILAALAVSVAVGCVHIPTEKEVAQGQTYYDLGVNALKYGHFEEALDNFTRSVTFNPNFADAHMGLGLVWWRKAKIEGSKDDYENARQEFEKAVELRPDFSDAWNNLGALSIERNDLARAKVAFKTALADPVYKTPYVARSNLGWVYHLQGNDKEALQQIREAILSQPDYCVGHKQLASVLEDLKKTDEANEQWAAFVRYCPEDPDAQYHSGMMLEAAGQLEDAAKAFLRCRLQAIKINPVHVLVQPCTSALSQLPPISAEAATKIQSEISPQDARAIAPQDLDGSGAH